MRGFVVKGKPLISVLGLLVILLLSVVLLTGCPKETNDELGTFTFILKDTATSIVIEAEHSFVEEDTLLSILCDKYTVDYTEGSFGVFFKFN